MNLSASLEKLNRAIRLQDAELLSQVMADLYAATPDKWTRLIFLSEAIPPLHSDKFASVLSTVLRAAQVALEQSALEPFQIMQILLPLAEMSGAFSDISRELVESELWELPAVRTIYRLASYLEDQNTISAIQLEQEVEQRGHFDAVSMLASSIVPTRMGGVKSSRVGVYEEGCENLQLVLAYSMQRFKAEFFGDIGKPRSPYLDGGFAQLIALASTWRAYQHVWSSIKYLAWRPKLVDKDRPDVHVYFPPDKPEYIRHRVAGIRMQQYMSEATLNQAAHSPPTNTNHVTLAASTITIPSIGQLWNGAIDTQTFKQALSDSSQLYEDMLSVNGQYYIPLLEEVVLKSSTRPIPWQLYWKVNKALRTLAEVFESAISAQAKDLGPETALQRVIVVEEERLCNVLVSATDVTWADCQLALESLTFNPGHTELEIWDAPLIRSDENRFLVVPSLVIMGSAARSAENIISQWNEPLLEKRGKLLERRLLQFFQAQDKVKAQGPVKFQSRHGLEIECDLVLFWDGFLLLVEAKCTKEVTSPSDVYRAKSRIEDAITQLNVRRDAIFENWVNFVTSAASLGLPKAPMPSERIRMIAVTNVLDFTSWYTNEVLVTDEICLRRFFGNPDVELFKWTSQGRQNQGAFRRIRNNSIPSAREFLAYLRHPPQVEVVAKAMDEKILWLPKLSGQQTTLGFFHAVYNPDRNALVKEYRRILNKQAGTRRRRRHEKRRPPTTGNNAFSANKESLE